MSNAVIESSTNSVASWLARRDFKNAHIHLVGVGGSGMAGLAGVLLRGGAQVSGSDRNMSAVLLKLRERGARVIAEQTADSIPPEAQLVVASAAIPDQHPELLEARRREIPIAKYAQMLGALMGQHHGVAIAGTHGKSTTTAWTTFVLRQAGLDPSFIIGAEVDQLGGSSGVGIGPHFVAESCEYDRSFLNMRPRHAVILNIEEDHLDYYVNLAEILQAFGDFARLVPEQGMLLVNGEDARCRAIVREAGAPVQTFGLIDGVTWQAADLRLDNGRYSFAIRMDGVSLGRVTIGLSGRHNVYNALAVSALALSNGVSWEVLREALAEFRGADRRLQLRAEVNGVFIADDYAHHPTEIRATLQAARERFNPRRLWCIFQPHQHSRTRFLLADFARSFDLADQVVVPDIYFVRDSARECERVSSADLVERIRDHGGEAIHIQDFERIVDHVVTHVGPGDLVLTMGAGDIWKAADELVQRIRQHLPNRRSA